MNLGSATPTLAAVGSPHVDARGLWVDMRAEYTGNFTMSLETKLDLMKLKRGAGLSSHSPTLSSSNPPSPAEPVPTSQAQVGEGSGGQYCVRYMTFYPDLVHFYS